MTQSKVITKVMPPTIPSRNRVRVNGGANFFISAVFNDEVEEISCTYYIFEKSPLPTPPNKNVFSPAHRSKICYVLNQYWIRNLTSTINFTLLTDWILVFFSTFSHLALEILILYLKSITKMFFGLALSFSKLTFSPP